MFTTYMLIACNLRLSIIATLRECIVRTARAQPTTDTDKTSLEARVTRAFINQTYTFLLVPSIKIEIKIRAVHRYRDLVGRH